MPRKKVSLQYIANPQDRKSSFKKRKKGLIKKVTELSILAGVDACVVIHSEYDPHPEVWPSKESAEEVYSRFNRLSEIEKNRKKADPISFTSDRLQKTKQQITRLQNANRREQMEQFIWKCRAGIITMEGYQKMDTSHVMSFIKQKSEEFKFRIEEFQNDQLHNHVSSGPSSSFFSTPRT